MTIGTWEPDKNQQQEREVLSSEFLERAIAASFENRLENLDEVFALAEQSRLATAMRQSEEQWLQAVNALSSAHIYHLMRFLTVAEMAFNDCEAGPNSPVISLNKLLKTRGEALQKEQVLWIKSHTRNRYLPNGAVL
ncbi:MAG: hypothetical protein AAF542_13150 [Pseudomonadota bacterium]